MSRFIRRHTAVGAYSAALERLIPRLEELLYRRLQRLETKVVKHELRDGLSTSRLACKVMCKPQRAIDVDLGAGRPSVILLGARLKADQRYCRTLIQRAAAIVCAGLAARCGESRAKIKTS
jgi:hypothetical protein